MIRGYEHEGGSKFYLSGLKSGSVKVW